MVSLKVIKCRIRSVNNTKKITQTMRVVSAAKYSKAERELIGIRPFGKTPLNFFELTKVAASAEAVPQLVVAISSDRGLCGGIHSGIARIIRSSLEKSTKLLEGTKIICVGERIRAILSRMYPENILWVATDVNRKEVTFQDAGIIAGKIKESVDEYRLARTLVYYNKFVNAQTYGATFIDLYDRATIFAAERFTLYDMIDDETMDCWLEFTTASMIYWMLKESGTSEQAARMVAMETATKNATEMISFLTVLYNRTRQSVITGELIEIISGANALEKKD